MKKILYIQLLLFLTSFEKIYPENFCEKFYYCCCEGCLKDNKEEEEEEEEKLKKEEKKIKEEEFLNNLCKKTFKHDIEIKDVPFNTDNKDCNYEIVKDGTKNNDSILGQGFSGATYKVREKKFGDICVIKEIIIEHNDEDAETKKKNIENEIKNMIDLRGEKYIVNIYDCFLQKEENRDVYYIVMEYVTGDTLLEITRQANEEKIRKYEEKKQMIIKKSTQTEDIDEKYIANQDRIAYEIINALYNCHEKNIYHMDFKRENIMLDKNFNVNIIDFGAAVSGNEKSSAGTWWTMSYERINNKEYDNTLADIYSMGVVLFELYERVPFGDQKKREEMQDDYFKEQIFLDRTECLNEMYNEDQDLKEFLEGVTAKFEKERWNWDKIFNSNYYRKIKALVEPSDNKKK